MNVLGRRIDRWTALVVAAIALTATMIVFVALIVGFSLPSSSNADTSQPSAPALETVYFSPDALDGLTLMMSMIGWEGSDDWTYNTHACDVLRDLFVAAKESPAVDFSVENIVSDLSFAGNVGSGLRSNLEYLGYGGTVSEIISVGTYCAEYIAYWE